MEVTNLLKYKSGCVYAFCFTGIGEMLMLDKNHFLLSKGMFLSKKSFGEKLVHVLISSH